MFGPRPGNRQTLLISSPDWTETSCSSAFTGRTHRQRVSQERGREVRLGGRGGGRELVCVFFLFGFGFFCPRSCYQTPRPRLRLHKRRSYNALPLAPDGPHKMSLMLTWLWRSGGGTKGRGILRPLPAPALTPPTPPFFLPFLGPDTNKRIRSPRFRQALHSRQSLEQLSVTLNDKSANLCQSLWAGIPVFEG